MSAAHRKDSSKNVSNDTSTEDFKVLLSVITSIDIGELALLAKKLRPPQFLWRRLFEEVAAALAFVSPANIEAATGRGITWALVDYPYLIKAPAMNIRGYHPRDRSEASRTGCFYSTLETPVRDLARITRPGGARAPGAVRRQRAGAGLRLCDAIGGARIARSASREFLNGRRQRRCHDAKGTGFYLRDLAAAPPLLKIALRSPEINGCVIIISLSRVGCVRPLSLFYSDASADEVEERSLAPRSRSHAQLRQNVTMSHPFLCVQPAFIDL
ncbi:hypothetical protein EVAR_41105_1 [Eumeta japonica]|uniref:Uncharacterized protein n=1 Tax=Eumeta variegata TaxID=151549 RepID=A0A4C1XAG2_EUMVA|nr:hypothetical protein EVAR_41105_1 [Eumeta japonica]